MADCIFCRIAKKELATNLVYEDDATVAFNDIAPQAPTHILVIPKTHIGTLNEVTDYSIYAGLFAAVDKIVKEKGLSEPGYRVVANCGKDGGQAVGHIHLHILGGRPMKWPPG